jgi:ADP-heptose:LPS heptosyltransferase
MPMAMGAIHTTPNWRVLVIFPGALGDLICLVPAVRAIARRNPGATLELMARGELARFAVGRLGFERGHSIDRREVGHLFAANERVSEEARAFFGAFDRVYSFFAGDDPNFRRSLEDASADRVSFHPFCPPGDGHVVRCYLRVLGENDPSPLKNRIEFMPHDIESAARITARLGFVPHSFVLILPGSGSPTKNWPAANFAALAERTAAPSLALLGPAEAGLKSFFDARGIAAVSDLELGEVTGLAHLARCFLGNDSGVSHLASASGARGLVLFGPTDPARWRPLGDVKLIHRDPLDTLPVAEVLAALEQLLSEQRTP